MAASLRFPPLPSIADLLKLYRLRARKQLAQNFLFDERITNKIVKQLSLKKGSYVMEVGPGPGCLTRSILKKLPEKLIVIEKDTRFKPTLDMLAESFATVNGKMDIIYNDILESNLNGLFPEECRKKWTNVCPDIAVIGNLPFNVATPLIIRWLKSISLREGLWSMGRVRMCLTFQKEVAERLVAQPGDKQRCRLSVMAQAWTKPRLRFIIPGRVFIPKPEVDVGVVTFEPLAYPLTDHEFHIFEKVTRQVFSMPRKYCKQGTTTLFPKDFDENLTMMMLKLADVSPETRPTNLTVLEMHRLCSAYKYLIEKYPAVENYNYRASRKVITRSSTKFVVVSELPDKNVLQDPQVVTQEYTTY